MKQNSAGKILRNSYWYSIEMALETLIFLGSSVAVARYLGPVKLGHFAYISFFISVVQSTGGNGLATTTRKYVSECIAAGELGMARSVYQLTHRYQFLYALVVAVGSAASVLAFGDPEYRIMSCILIASVIPGLLTITPAHTNQAFEDVAANTISALGYLASYLVVILLTLYFHWDLIGVACATLVGRTVEVVWRITLLNRKMSTISPTRLDQAFVSKIRKFCLEATGLQLITTAAFGRTELFFLKAFCRPEQIAFYSVSASLASNLQIPSRILGFSTGATLMVETSRDARRAASIIRNAATYILISLLPVTLGAAAIAYPVVWLVYGTKYLAAVPALSVAVILTMPWAFAWIPDTLMRVADKQKRLLFWVSVTAIFNALIDLILIPRFGAVGAAWGAGLGQVFGLIATWIQGRKFFEFKFPVRIALRVTAASGLAAGLAYGICRVLSPLPGVALAIPSAALCYVLLLRVFHILNESDVERLGPIGRRLPGSGAKIYAGVLRFLVVRKTALAPHEAL